MSPKLIHFLRIDLPLMGRILIMRIPGFLQEVGVSILIVLVNNINNRIGAASSTALLAIFGILNRLLLFIITPLIGIAQGFMPIVGYNYGAKNTERMKSAFSVSTVSSFVVTAGIIPLRLMFCSPPYPSCRF